jgi:hypothetical protein
LGWVPGMQRTTEESTRPAAPEKREKSAGARVRSEELSLPWLQWGEMRSG